MNCPSFELLPRSQVGEQSGTAPETSQTYGRENQQYNEDRSQNDPHSEVVTSVISVIKSHHCVNLDPDVVRHSIRNIKTDAINFELKYFPTLNWPFLVKISCLLSLEHIARFAQNTHRTEFDVSKNVFQHTCLYELYKNIAYAAIRNHYLSII